MPCGTLKYKIVDNIDLNTFYGFAEVHIEVPNLLYNYFGEFPPIVKNMEYLNEICAEYTAELLNNKFTKSRKLIATFEGEKLVMSTRLKWLIDHGCIITKIYGVIEAIPRKIFEGFMNWVSNERRKGDIDQKYMIIAECCKLIGNSNLKLKQFIMCENVGFRKCNGVMSTYSQFKIGITPIYTKGVVLKNGVNIAPLKI